MKQIKNNDKTQTKNKKKNHKKSNTIIRYETRK